ncbi:hypothetical protein F5144DRAFT_651385 [Chaetomium tenue]|uniref:Uncharacterized protein n=1 Tax=Chaetomium tenue TaxID=1854479 RepID=A0ACB7PCD3_9PEZI|nr:hypothetical protein F5144DRAFT_651385 [Chaetomium globosum]
MALPDACQDEDHDGQSCSSTPAPPTPAPPLVPRPLSINRLLAIHARERLLVHPLCWTDRQPALLGCRIHDHDEEALDNAETTAAESFSRALPPRLSLSHLLTTIFNDGEFAATVETLVQALGGRIWVAGSRATSLYFHCRPGPSIRFYHLSVLIPGPDPQRITLACLDYRDIEDAREEHFKPPPNRLHRTDRPGLRRARILSRHHTPKEAEKDPFLVALIIALRKIADVRVLCLGDGLPRPVHLYVAHVQARFLNKLDFPNQEPAAEWALDIDHWGIAAKPFETLPHRLCRVLKPRQDQEADAENLGEPWVRATRKRKRGDTLDKDGSALKRK